MAGVPTREATLRVVQHPVFLACGGEPEAVLVDPSSHPDVGLFADGDPAMGWEGDPRLALYSWPRKARFMLMRLEADGSYGIVSYLDWRAITTDNVKLAIRDLQRRDTRRGFDVGAYASARNTAADVAKDKARSDWIEGDVAPRLLFALAKDGVAPRKVFVP